MMERIRGFLIRDTKIVSDTSLTPSDELEQARLAHRNASVLNSEVQARAPRVERVSRQIAEIRARNHFGEAVEISMRTRKGRPVT